MSGYAFWLGLWLACLNSVLIGHQFWGLIGLMYFTALLFFTFPGRCWLTLAVGLGFFMHWQGFEARLNQVQREWATQVQRPVCLTVYQADCQFHQRWLSGIGRLPTGETLRFRYRSVKTRLEPLKKQKFKVIGLASGAPIEDHCNVYGFNQRQYWRSKGIGGQVNLDPTRTSLIPCPDDAWALIKRLQGISVDWFKQFPAGVRDFGTALLLGQVRERFYQDYAGLVPLGLIHLFSISGFQVIFYWRLWQWCWRWLGIWQEVTWWHWQFGLGFIWIFAQQAASLLRPILASLVGIWQRFGWVKWSPLDRYGYVLMASLGCAPGVLLTLGGQLSFLLALGLLLLSKVRPWRQTIYLNVLIAPLLIWHSYSWHPGSLMINLLAIPFFSFLLIPGLLAAILAWPLGIQWIARLMDVLIKGFQFSTNTLAQLPGEIVFGRPPKELVLILTIVVLGACLMQKLRWLWLLPLVGGIFIIGRPLWQPPFLAFLDVGQGDAIVWREPSGKTYMNDVGGQIGPAQQGLMQRNAKAKTVWQFCKGQGITELEWLILSHRDWDHIGNLKEVSQQIRIKHLGLPSGMEKTVTYRRWIQPYLKNTQVHPLTVGDRVAKNCQVLHPFTSGGGENKDSIALFLVHQGLRIILTGDLDQAGEERMTRQLMLPQVDILKFGHHGSITSTSTKFLETIRPRYGIISAGKDNRFGHPHPEVLARAARYRINLLSTAQDGLLLLVQGHPVNWQTEEGLRAGFN